MVHVVAVLVGAAGRHVLVDDLHLVAVDVVRVDDLDVLGRTVVALERVAPVALLELPGFLEHAVRAVSKASLEERVPLGVGERDVVQLLHTAAQVRLELVLSRDGQVRRALRVENMDEPVLESGLALIVGLVLRHGLVARQEQASSELTRTWYVELCSSIRVTSLLVALIDQLDHQVVMVYAHDIEDFTEVVCHVRDGQGVPCIQVVHDSHVERTLITL